MACFLLLLVLVLVLKFGTVPLFQEILRSSPPPHYYNDMTAQKCNKSMTYGEHEAPYETDGF